MHRLVEISLTGLASVRLHPLRSLVSLIAVVAVLLPYLAGIAISHGIQAEAAAAVAFGSDLYVTGSRFGRPVPVNLLDAERIRALNGVKTVVPRVVGAVVIGKNRVPAVIIGLPAEQLPDWSKSVEGQLPRNGGPNQLVVGTALARRLDLRIGSMLLPFYRNDKGERLSRVVGVFKSDNPFWQANLILTTLETAQSIFDQPGRATDFLVTCRPGYQDAVSRLIEREIRLSDGAGEKTIQPRVTAREDLLAVLPRGLLHREGIFNLHFLLAIVVAILVLLVTSGFGLAERRREIGILKATGWQTDQILLRGLVESLVISVAAACLSLLLAWIWLRLLGGYGIVGLFIAGADAAPAFPAPFRLAPVPALLAFAFSLVIVLSGTLYSSWRAAIASPREAMR